MHAACNNRFPLRQALLAAALGGASLCGCTQKPDDYALGGGFADDAAAQLTYRPAPRPAESAYPSALVRTHPAAHALPQKPAGKAAKFDPGLVVGLEPPAVDRMLGRPAGTRTDATTVEWTYGTASCSLSIYFYPDVTTGTLRALKYNVTNGQAGRGCVHFPIMARSDESD